MKFLRIFFIITCIFIFYKSEAFSEHSPIHSDEEVILFPSLAWQDKDDYLTNHWSVSLHGWIFEPEYDSIRRNILLSSFCHALKLFNEECDSEIFKQRARFFVVDNERSKILKFSLGNYLGTSQPSGKEGHFRAEFKIQKTELFSNILPNAPLNDIRIDTSDNNFTSELISISPKGISVISDIDDTIKISDVTDKDELLRNTFLRDFKAAPGMVTLYRELASKKCAFHYVSASPWQLYPALGNFMDQVGFPKGTFHLKDFRWKDSRFLDLLQSPHLFKTPIINSLIKKFPDRRFILIGDSGEQDPEIYGEIAKNLADRDIRILIREIISRPITEERLKNSFKSMPRYKWAVIHEDKISNTKEILDQFLSN